MPLPPAVLHARYSRYEWAPVTIGMSAAQVWRLTGPSSLFVKTSCGSTGPDPSLDVTAEAARLDWLSGTGIPVPQVVDFGADDDLRWLVTTAVPGRSAAQRWPAEQRVRVVDALADVTRELHALSIAEYPFDRSLSVTIALAGHLAAAELVDLDDLDDERQGWTVDQLSHELARTCPTQEQLVVCHGDLCLPNVILDPQTLDVTGVVDVGRLGTADRYADLALVTRSLADASLNPEYGEPLAIRFLRRYGEPSPDHDRLAFYRLLDEFF